MAQRVLQQHVEDLPGRRRRAARPGVAEAELDDWGYPIVAPGPVPPELEGHARRAVAACPTLALMLTRAAAQPASAASRRRSSKRGGAA